MEDGPDLSMLRSSTLLFLISALNVTYFKDYSMLSFIFKMPTFISYAIEIKMTSSLLVLKGNWIKIFMHSVCVLCDLR